MHKNFDFLNMVHKPSRLFVKVRNTTNSAIAPLNHLTASKSILCTQTAQKSSGTFHVLNWPQ